jgi:2Fe-2S iron-sulfur cluster binding domain
MSTTIKVNGVERAVDADGDTPLLWVLRDILGMTGTKFGCGVALCGACTVHVDGVATRSYITPIDGIGSNRLRILGRQTRRNAQELRLQIHGGGKEIILFCPSRKLVEVGRQDRFECICVYAPQKPLLVLECATFTASHVPKRPCAAPFE